MAARSDSSTLLQFEKAHGDCWFNVLGANLEDCRNSIDATAAKSGQSKFSARASRAVHVVE
jgi:hypothetical protein